MHGGARHCCADPVRPGVRQEWMNIHDQRPTSNEQRATKPRNDAGSNLVPSVVPVLVFRITWTSERPSDLAKQALESNSTLSAELW